MRKRAGNCVTAKHAEILITRVKHLYNICTTRFTLTAHVRIVCSNLAARTMGYIAYATRFVQPTHTSPPRTVLIIISCESINFISF